MLTSLGEKKFFLSFDHKGASKCTESLFAGSEEVQTLDKATETE